MSLKVKKSPSRTAEEVALVRVGESQKPEDERICYDPLAIHFISQKTLESLRQDPEIDKENEVLFRVLANTIVARVRYFDDFVRKSIDKGLEQLVILGAGYDTRAYRIEGLKNVKVFEIDHLGTQSVKIEKLKELFGSLPDYVEYVPIDFENETLGENLFNHEYDPSKKTLFLMEGLTMYIPPEAIDEILSFIVGNSGEGSAVIFDYASIPANTDKNPDMKLGKNLAKFMEESDESMKFALEEGGAEKFLSERGFSNIENMTSEDYKKAYFYGKNRDNEVFNLIWFVHAVVD